MPADRMFEPFLMNLPWSFRRFKTARPQNPQRGYLLLTLMLVFALIAMTHLVVLQNLIHQVQRDREEELCHRGTEYMRAIRRYHRAMGRYPTSLQDLEGSNGKRFIRKLYKDPMSRDAKTGQEREFKLLHPQDVVLNGSLSQQGGEKWQESLSGNLKSADSSDDENQTQDSASEPSDSSDATTTDSAKPAAKANKPSAAANGTSAAPGSGFQFEGNAPIIGVASTNKAKTIREFNKKNHYDEWYFIYDASVQSIGLLVGPWQPLAFARNVGMTNTPQANGARAISQPASSAPQTPTVPAGDPQTSP